MSTSPVTIANLVYLQPSTLASLLSDPQSAAKTAVIDVRDSDHVGGHIKGSTWVPLSELDVRIPELIRLNKDKERVVFHCMLSQERGPTAALRFARAQQAKRLKEQEAHQQQKQEEEEPGQQDGESNAKFPQVCVLAGGFQAWRIQYGEKENLTEAYAKDLWDWH